LTVPIEDEQGWTTKTWPRSELVALLSGPTEDTELQSALVNAVTSKKRIQVSCVLSQSSKSSASRTLIPANKTYYLMFLQTQGQFGGNAAR